MRNKVLRICESCIWFCGWSFMACLCGLIVYGISFAFWHLITDLIN